MGLYQWYILCVGETPWSVYINVAMFIWGKHKDNIMSMLATVRYPSSDFFPNYGIEMIKPTRADTVFYGDIMNRICEQKGYNILRYRVCMDRKPKTDGYDF